MGAIIFPDKFTPATLKFKIKSVAFGTDYVRIGVSKRIPLLEEKGLKPEFQIGRWFYTISHNFLEQIKNKQ